MSLLIIFILGSWIVLSVSWSVVSINVCISTNSLVHTEATSFTILPI